MKIFLSWSGPRSRAVAEALNDWLRRVIQVVKPFYSPEIEKGVKWSGEIDNALEGTRFGLVCLTPDNLESVWVHFEAGALSKTREALVWTFLHGLAPADVPPPLSKFQATTADKTDTLRLVRTINARLADVGAEPLTDQLLEENFELFWPQLEKRLLAAEKITSPIKTQGPTSEAETQRDLREILNEVLELARAQDRRLSRLQRESFASRQIRSIGPDEDTFDVVEVDIVASEDIDPIAERIRELVPNPKFEALQLADHQSLLVVSLREPMPRAILRPFLGSSPHIRSWRFSTTKD